jgi:hypothetical protein
MRARSLECSEFGWFKGLKVLSKGQVASLDGGTLVKLLLLVALLLAIDFVMLNGRYSLRVWHQAHGQAISTEVSRWMTKLGL